MQSIIDKNNNGDFVCNINTSGGNVEQTENNNGNGGMCQLFEFIDKEKNNDPLKCPDKLDELKPISFKDEKKANYLPDVFLFAVKYKNSNVPAKTHQFSEIFVGNTDDENKKLMSIYTTNITSSLYKKCTNIN